MKELKSLRALQKIKRDDKKLSPAKRRGLPRKLFRFIVLVIFTLIVGGMGGIILDRFGLPYLSVRFPELNKYEFLKSVGERTIIIEKTVETKISADRARVEAIKKITPSLATAAFFNKEIKNGEIVDFLNGNNKKTGFIFTSDGLIIAKMDRPPKKNEIVKIKFLDGKILDARWIGFDKSSGVAVLKTEYNNLSVVTFADSDNLELGEELIAVSGEMIMDASVSQIANDYSFAVNLKEENNSAAQKRILLTKNLSQNFYGTPLINIKGEIIGISEKENLVIPINGIRDFIDEMLKK